MDSIIELGVEPKLKIDQIVQKIVSITDFINTRDTKKWSFSAFDIDI